MYIYLHKSVYVIDILLSRVIQASDQMPRLGRGSKVSLSRTLNLRQPDNRYHRYFNCPDPEGRYRRHMALGNDFPIGGQFCFSDAIPLLDARAGDEYYSRGDLPLDRTLLGILVGGAHTVISMRNLVCACYLLEIEDRIEIGFHHEGVLRRVDFYQGFMSRQAGFFVMHNRDIFRNGNTEMRRTILSRIHRQNRIDTIGAPPAVVPDQTPKGFKRCTIL